MTRQKYWQTLESITKFDDFNPIFALKRLPLPTSPKERCREKVYISIFFIAQ
jgi:hypothetical protein